MKAHYKSTFAPGLFTDRVVVVTGGGSGIGRCTAHELASLGAQVVLIGRSPDKLRATAAEIIHDGGHASFYACDIRQEDTVKATVAAVIASHGRVDGARPQVRMGWPMALPNAEVRERASVKPFDGFHRAVVPKVFAA